MTDAERAIRYKELRKLVRAWIRASYFYLVTERRQPTGLKHLEDAEAALREFVCGEEDLFNAAVAVGSPAAEKDAAAMLQDWPTPKSDAVKELLRWERRLAKLRAKGKKHRGGLFAPYQKTASL